MNEKMIELCSLKPKYKKEHGYLEIEEAIFLPCKVLKNKNIFETKG